MKKLEWFFIILLSINSIISFFPIKTMKAATTKVPWENQGLNWYYDNLDDDDRRKIRQAMDYAIPRQVIIDELHQGLAVPLATEIGQNIMGYDDSVQFRESNLTKSKSLLAEVFNKTYNAFADVNSTNETKFPYFSMKLVAPTTSAARTLCAAPITENFKAIGIDVELKWWNWNIVMPRIYYDPKGVGYNYDHEGVDAWFIGMNMDIDPDLSSQYFISEFAPKGDNAFWIENDVITAIINRSLTHPDLRERLVALSDYQHWFSEQVPKSIIQQGLDIFAMDENLQGFDTYLVGRGWCFNNWTIGSQTELTYTVPGDFVDFNPLLSNSNYDHVPMRNVFGALSQRRGAYNLTHSVPQIAESWSSNLEGTVWEVKITDEIKWSDGTNLTVEDVLFTYHAVFEDDLASPKQKFFLDRFPGNASDIYLKSGTTDIIVFELGAFYPYVTSQVFGLPILQKAQLEGITFGVWKTHTLNTGRGSEYYYGCGPYMMTDFGLSNGVTLEKNPYFNPTAFGHDPTAVGGGIFFNEGTFETIHVVVVKEATAAISGLEAGVYDILDSQTGVNAQYEDLNEPDNEYESKCIVKLEYGWEELNYNHYDPRWGMNAHDPRELYDEYKPKNLISEHSFLILGALYLLLGGLLVILAITVLMVLKRKISEIP